MFGVFPALSKESKFVICPWMRGITETHLSCRTSEMFSQYHCVAPDGADRQFPPFGKSYHESSIMMMHASNSIKPVGQSPKKLGWGTAVPSLSFMLHTDLVSQDGRTINVPI